MKAAIALALLLCSAPAATATVVVASGNWDHLPDLGRNGQAHLNNKSIARIMEVVGSRKCTLPGQRYGKLDFSMSFAAQFEPNGKLQRVVLPKLNCGEVESILGGVVVEMIEGGDYRPSGNSPEGWYKGQLGFEAAL